MLKLTDSLEKITNIGPKYYKLLQTLGLQTVEDLLYYFPFRYEDLATVKLVKDVAAGETITLKGQLTPLTNIFTKNGKRLTKAKVLDHTGNLDIIWFNQHYLKKSLRTGVEYTFSGKVDLFDSRPCLISPVIEVSRENSVHTGRLVPVYPETAGINSKWIRTKINDLIDNHLAELKIEEYLPESITNKYTLKELNWSLKNIHFPDSENNANLARNRFAFEELFVELLKIEMRKDSWIQKIKGMALNEHENEISSFISKLPFELTESQKTATKHIIEKLGLDHPMNMLLEGDVGSGKTMVAIICSYLTYLNDFKTIYMAPTEILAQQHYDSFKKFLEPFGVKVELITGSRKPTNTEWHILIGTHAILYSKGFYTGVGLVIIDEQHRFGVEQRGKILEISNDLYKPHFLSMTATPIPRTLALTLYGDLDIVALKEHPNKEREVITKVVGQTKRDETYAWVKQKDEPTFIVCPFIEESESESLVNVKAAQKEFSYLKEGIFSDVPIGLLHGRMPGSEKQEMIEKFRNGAIKVLVSTPVIEVGVDIPDATIMIIESAERYGLASLHQLRGRVGRGKSKGFCFVMLSNYSKTSYARLKNLEEISNGLELAEIDMKTRGQGDVFGTMQHGYKKFKVASLDNIQLIENAKIAAQEIFPELSKHTVLKDMLVSKTSSYVKNN